MMSKHQSFDSQAYLRDHPTWHAEDSRWKAQQILKIIHQQKLSPRSVCEIGCGAGLILATLHEAMPDHVTFVGYETAPEAFSLCSNLTRDRLSFKRESPVDKGLQFDLSCCIDVMEHVEDYLDFLRRIHPLATYHVFHIPLEITIERLLRRNGFVAMRKKYNHLHHFTAQTACASLKDSGYEILEQFYTPSEIALPAKSRGQWLARLPRRLMFSLHQGLAARTTGGVSLMVLAR